MKNKILGLSALLIAAVFAFAFKAEPLKRIGVRMVLASGQNPFDPLQYSTYGGTDPVASCPDDSRVCIIDVSSSDLYTSLDAPTPAHIGKPKVDINTSATNELFDQIQDAVSTPGEQDPEEPVNGRVIYERSAQ